jgi:glucose/mannose transport system permease protein
MAVKWSKVAPQLALAPAVLVALVAFFGAIVWTVWLSFTKSRQFPDYTIVGWKQYYRLFHDEAWLVSLKNMIVLGIGSLLSIVFGFILAAMIDKEVRGEGIFRTIFLYPLAVSLIVTGLVWQWLFNPGLGIENFLHELGWTSAHFNWLASGDTVMFGIILASVWQSTGFFMALMLSGLKSISTRRSGRRRGSTGCPSGAPISSHHPMMKLTFLTCVILLFDRRVKAMTSSSR